ncbi:uncharacterized protein LOC142333748 [Lycorma delicatula]|uniref:uncharacterized protein LOC142333748 n=1 Tax=Lycorma delicatula TaxID=130591 RepID=UPI003F5176BF
MNRNQFNSPFSQNNSPDARWRSSFGESPSPDFIPFEYSSPLSSYKQNSRKFRACYQNNQMRVYDKSFSSPPSSASSMNSSFNNSFGFYQSNNSNKKHDSSHKSRYKKKNNNNDKYDSSLYYHESMIEDPWEHLEKKLIEEGEIKIDENDCGREESNASDRSNLGSNSSNSSNISTKHKNSNKETEEIQKDDRKAVSVAVISTTEKIPTIIDSTDSDLQ